MLRIMFQISAGRPSSCLHFLPGSEESKTGYYITAILERCRENALRNVFPVSANNIPISVFYHGFT